MLGKLPYQGKSVSTRDGIRLSFRRQSKDSMKMHKMCHFTNPYLTVYYISTVHVHTVPTTYHSQIYNSCNIYYI